MAANERGETKLDPWKPTKPLKTVRSVSVTGCAEPVLLHVSEVATMLGLGRSKVYEMANAGELPVVKIGTAVRIPKKALLAWIDLHRAQLVDDLGPALF